MTQLIRDAKAQLSTSLVYEFATHWLTAYEQGANTSDCTTHAMYMTNVSLSVPEHREIARRALSIVSDSGVNLH